MVLINFISTSDCHCIPLSTSLVPQFLKMKHQRVESWDFLRPEVYFQFCSKKSVVGRKKFGTLENPTVLEDPLMSTNKIVIDLLWHTTSIAIPSHTSLDQEPAVLRPSSPPPCGLCWVQKKITIYISGDRAMGTNTALSQLSLCQ